MPYDRLVSQGKIQQHATSRKEIASLFQIVERELKDASIPQLSDDKKYISAYNAILQCATIIVYCEGFKTRGEAHHYITFRFIRETLGSEHQELIDYFDSCRKKRNLADYDVAGEISEKEVKEIIAEARKFYKFTKDFVSQNYPEYI